MQNFLQRGDTLNLPAPAVLASGQGVEIGSIFGVAATNAQPGDTVAIAVVGVFELPKAGNAFAVGDAVYWDATAGNVTSASAAPNVRIGVTVSSAAAADTVADIRLSGAF